MRATIATWIVAAVLSSSAAASDWYVDANAGSNANSGTAPSQAWRTISWAVSQVPPSGLQRIFVAPGTYDTALGETWPISMRDQLQILGAGPASTTLVGTGSSMFAFAAVGMGVYFGPDTRIHGLHLLGPGASGVAISCYANYGSATPSLAELEVESWQYGVAASVNTSGYSSPTLDSVDVHHCTIGLSVLGASTLTASDSSFRDNLQNGVSLVGAHGTPHPTFRRCRIEHNLGAGVTSTSSDYPARSNFDDCSISFNGGDGWSCPNWALFDRSGTFRRCTIAFNGGTGLFGFSTFNFCGTVELSQSIVWGHVADIDYDGTVNATRNDIGDGSFNGVAGNFSSAPLFVNAASDLQLGWGSPCIDAASVAPPAGTLDLRRNARDVDGDLNTAEIADLGAFEFRPLELSGPGTLGSLLQWELRGPPSAVSVLYWARKPLAASPSATPFGQLDLVPNQTNVYRVTTIGPSSSTTLQRAIPNAAFLVGQTFSFQALTDQPLAPNGKGYTNAVQFTIAP